MIGQARDQIKRSLAVEALRSGLHLHLCATGTSMLPTLWPGDLLTVESVGVQRVKPGDLVLYMREGRFFVHRLVEKRDGDRILITRGDCLSTRDAPVSAKDFLGKVVQVQRAGLNFAPRPKLSVFQLAFAQLLCHIAPLQQLVLRFHARYRAAGFDLTLVEDAC
jgi:signal peptidase I